MWRISYEKLVSWNLKTNRAPLIIHGARQIGKTYTIKDFAKKNFSNYFYFNFEEDSNLESFFQADLKPERVIQDLSLYIGKDINSSRDLIIFDEIQAAPKAITSLKYFAEKLPELALISAGSLLGLELNSSSYPVGKVEHLHMFPMTFLEFLRALDDTLFQFLTKFQLEDKISKPIHEKLLEYLKLYFIVGGMPKVVKVFIENYSTDNINQLFDLVRSEQSHIIETVMADIAKHSGKENSMHINQVWKHMPSKLNSKYYEASSRFRFKEAIPGKRKFKDFIGVLEWLSKASLVIKIPVLSHVQYPLELSYKESMFKLYNYDVGILARLSNLSPQRILAGDYGSFKGYFVENFIAQELRAQIPSLDEIYSWRDKDYELEFLITGNDGTIIPIEVKSGRKKTCTSLRKFIESFKPNRQVIFSTDNFSISGNTLNLPLYFPVEKFLASMPC